MPDSRNLFSGKRKDLFGLVLPQFISKLRRKLEFDPNIKIVIIRGKGYKLALNS
jgi:DNA-binding response OmpR family regulator